MSRRISESVQHAVFAAGAEDDHGSPVESWLASVRVGIFAFDPGSTSEPREAGRERVIVEPTMYCPDWVVFATRDRVTARGLLFEVEGGTREWRHPSGRREGNVVTLRRVEG